MTDRSTFLKLAAAGLTFVALGYEIAPATVMGPLLTVQFDSIDQVHIFRAVGGIYLALSAFWYFSSSKPEYSKAAVASVVFFMLGLAAGRIVSTVVDGVPSPLLAGATLVEIAIGAWGLAVLRNES
ncbi:MAG: hypothetical protein ACI8TX_002373 [Hyphomicrobiaceae bacterium]|jgi:hypothetical protein